MLSITSLTSADGQLCPVRRVLSGVVGKWQSLILLSLEDEPQRFSAIKRLIGDITQRVLTENLRDLERDGYVTRTVSDGSPVEVHYALTALGREFLDLFKPLIGWAVQRRADIEENRAAYDRKRAD